MRASAQLLPLRSRLFRLRTQRESAKANRRTRGAFPFSIIPAPVTAEARPGPGFTVTASTVIYVETGDERALAVGQYLSDVIGLAASGTPLAVQAASSAAPPGNIHLSSRGPGSTDEGYELMVEADGVTLEGESAAGLFYAVQTLRQLMPAFVEYEAVRFDKSRPLVIAPARIVDQPRFPWRGAMLDVARHFCRSTR